MQRLSARRAAVHATFLPPAIRPRLRRSASTIPAPPQSIMSTSHLNMNLDFRSDNVAGAHPLINASLATNSTGGTTPYGNSTLDTEVESRLRAIFSHPTLRVFPVATGTAANSLALTSISKPGGIIFAHRESHIVVDECGAPEYFSGGTNRIIPIDGPSGKISLKNLRREVERVHAFDVHGGIGIAVSITQPTEAGTVYSLEEIEGICGVAREFGLKVHMDGARFANAVVGLGVDVSEMTWKRGVDMLSFGGTKNGCWCAEALIFFDSSMTEEFPFLRKRAGQLLSKSRFVSAQFLAYLKDDLWLQLARHANDMGSKLADVFKQAPSSRLMQEPAGNELFVILSKQSFDSLEKGGVQFMDWPAPVELDLGADEVFTRFVTSFATGQEDIDGVARLLGINRSITNGSH